jgi:uncharacterized FlaG/YvyC family protein
VVQPAATTVATVSSSSGNSGSANSLAVSSSQPTIDAAKDAVTLSFSSQAVTTATSSALAPAAVKGNVSNPSNSGDSKLSEETALQFAEDVEKHLNKFGDTQVQFSVKITEDTAHGINFQVVDKESGKVLREFPPESLRELKTSVSIQNGVGLLLDSAA